MGILLGRPADPLWVVTPADGQSRNPLGYWCAPNAATPDYVAYADIEEFIAYGFIKSWLSPVDFSEWERLQKDDVCWLRESFLRALEWSVIVAQEPDLEFPVEHPDYDREYIDVGEDDDRVLLSWHPYRLTKDALCLAMSVDSNGGVDDSTSIWLSAKACDDPHRVRTAIAWARSRNELRVGSNPVSEPPWVQEYWQSIGAERRWFNKSGWPPWPSEWGCREFGKWFDRLQGTKND